MHALMIAVMAATMLVHSALVSVAGAAVLVAASIVCSALSRSRAFLREHVIDLWAMALVLLAFLPTGRIEGHHAVSMPSLAAFAVIVLAWAAARVWVVLQGHRARRVAVASGGLTAVGLAVMALVCA